MNSLIESLFGTQAKKEDEFEAYLFECSNENWDQTTATVCKITFPEENAIGKASPKNAEAGDGEYFMLVDHQAEGFNKKFALREMMNIDRFYDEDDNQVCFDWAVQNSLGEVHNYGLKFPNAAQGTNFGAKLHYLLEGGATKRCELSAEALNMYNPDKKAWDEIVKNVKVVISRRNVQEKYYA